MCQTAPEIAHQRLGKFDQPGGDAGAVHDLSGQDEERHRHEGEQVEPLKEPLGGHAEEIVAADLQQPGHTGDTQYISDRYTKQDEAEKYGDDDDHMLSTSGASGSAGG